MGLLEKWFHRGEEVRTVAVLPPFVLHRNASITYFTKDRYLNAGVEIEDARAVHSIFSKLYDSRNNFIYDALKLAKPEKINTRIVADGETSITSYYTLQKEETRAKPAFSTLLSLMTGGEIHIDKDALNADKNKKIMHQLSEVSKGDMCHMSEIPKLVAGKQEKTVNNYFDVKLDNLDILDAGTDVQCLPFGMAVVKKTAPIMIFAGDKKKYNCMGQFSSFLIIKSAKKHISGMHKAIREHECDNKNCDFKRLKEIIDNNGELPRNLGENDLSFVENLAKNTGYSIDEIRLNAARFKDDHVFDAYVIEDGIVVFDNGEDRRELYAPEYFVRNLAIIAKSVKMSISDVPEEKQEDDGIPYIR